MRLKNKKFKYVALVSISMGLTLFICFFSKDTVHNQEVKATVANSEVIELETTIAKELMIKPNNIPISGQAKPKIDKPIIFPGISYAELFSIEASNDYIAETQIAITKIQEALTTDDYTDSAKEAMTTELNRLQEVTAYYENDIFYYCKWEQEYYYATKVWQYLKQKGYSDAATCGIIGNMMTETGGHTMSLNPELYNKTGNFYGICQWSRKYYPEVMDKSFEYQLDFLETTIEKEFAVFGKLYKKGFTYSDFKVMTNPEEAAIAFAKVYERCGSGSYNKRQQGARKALEYFSK